MRSLILTFFTVLLVFTTPSAFAQTRMDEQARQTYYGNCMKYHDARMSKETQDIFCQCTSYFVQKHISMEEIQIMREQSQQARNVLNKVVTNVYAKCMEFPVRDLIFNECRKNKEHVSKGICTCLADHMASYTAGMADTKLSAVLQQTPNIRDPMDPIVNSPEFQERERRVVMQCLRENM